MGSQAGTASSTPLELHTVGLFGGGARQRHLRVEHGRVGLTTIHTQGFGKDSPQQPLENWESSLGGGGLCDGREASVPSGMSPVTL
jgi:hypothetical protein